MDPFRHIRPDRACHPRKRVVRSQTLCRQGTGEYSEESDRYSGFFRDMILRRDAPFLKMSFSDYTVGSKNVSSMQAESTQSIHRDIPFYHQHYDFTCGPASLMMAMKYLDNDVHLGKDLEIDLWREGNLGLSGEQAGMVWLFLRRFVDFLQELPAIRAELILLKSSFHHLTIRTCRCLKNSFTNGEPDAENWGSGKNRKPSPAKPFPNLCFRTMFPWW